MTIPRNLSFLAEGASSTGVLNVPYGGTGNVTLTAGYIPYGNGTGAFNSSSNLFFDSTNNRLGIGTSSPLQILHLSSASNTVMQITYLGVAASQVGVVSRNALTFGLDGTNGATERMCIDSSGRLGIATTSPSYTLDVSGTFRNTGIARLGTGSTTTIAFIGDDSTVGTKIIQFSRASAVTDVVNIQGINAGVGASSIALQALGGGVSIGNTTDPGSGNLSVTGTVKTGGYTVATLPTGVTGARAYVTNALTPTFGSTVVGGGTVTIPVFYNGTNWIVG